MGTSFCVENILYHCLSCFKILTKFVFKKITDVTEDSSIYFLKLSAVRKVLETMKFQALGSFETLGSKLSHGTS